MKSVGVSKSVELINYELHTDGYSVLYPNDHFFSEYFSIKKRYSKELKLDLSKPYKVSIFREKDFKSPKNQDLLAYNNFCLKLIKILSYDLVQFSAIYTTYDNEESKHIAQQPHFDRIPTLKFMLYLNDLKFENGAFCLSPGSHHWTKEKFQINRKNFHDKNFFNDTRNIPNPIIDRLTPIEGKLGTIIIFNTDCIHHQGVVKSGEACIVRSHYARKDFNKKFKIKNYIKKFF